MSVQFLYGIHDPGGEHLMADAPGTIVYTVNVAEDTPIDFGALAERGFRALVRINHSHHGQGTIPPDAADWPRFAETCARFVGECRGTFDFTIGNEPNLKVEWGRPEPVMPEQYAACYRLVYDAVKSLYSFVSISPAAIGPWNIESGVEWVEYFRRMLNAIGPSSVDFLCLHAYSRGYSPQSVTDNTWMEAPYQNRHNGFRAYKDFLDAVPAGLRSVPVDIKESNGNEPWPDANTGWVQAAYAEIHRHNGIVGTQKIRTLAMFRWASFDTRWDFSNKPGVHADFRAAVAHKYPAPDAAIAAQPTPQPPTVNLPTVSAGPATLPARAWDERLTQRGVQIQPANAEPGQAFWRVIEAKWFNEQESGGRYHIYARVLDEQGRVVSGVPLRVNWPDGEHRLVTEDKPAREWEYPANFPMGRSLSEFSIRVDDGSPSEIVSGIGRGADGNLNIHTSTLITFQRATQPGPPPPSSTVNIPTVTVAQTLYVTAPAGLNVRKEPTTDAEIVTRLQHGTGVEVSVKQGDWWAVSGGWLHGAWLSETKPEPVVEPVQDKWERSYAFTARWEGGFQNHRNDRGNWTGGQVGKGELKGTNWGISAASYPHLDIRNLTKEQAKQIYFRDYWQASGAAELDWPGCLIVFDTAVLHGVGRARQWVQEAGTNPLHFAARRLRSYVALENWHFWGAAWTRRVADLLEAAAK